MQRTKPFRFVLMMSAHSIAVCFHPFRPSHLHLFIYKVNTSFKAEAHIPREATGELKGSAEEEACVKGW